MSAYDEGSLLFRRGQYAKALAVLERAPVVSNTVQHELLKAEILVTLGRSDAAAGVLSRIVSAPRLSELDRAQAEFIEYRLCVVSGDFEGQNEHLHRAILLAEKAGDLRRLCIARIRLVALVADKNGLESVRPILTTLRSNVSSLGDPTITAWMHLCVAEIDAKSGFLERARRRTLMSLRILDDCSHHDLMALAYNNLTAVSILESDFESANEFGKKAAHYIEESGALVSRLCYLGNSGYLAQLTGRFADALALLNESKNLFGPTSEQTRSMLETMARVHLAEGKYHESLQILAHADVKHEARQDHGRYVHRYSVATRGEVLFRLARYVESVQCFDRAVDLAKQSGDAVLEAVGNLMRIEVRLHLGEQSGISADFFSLARRLSDCPHHVYALYERVMACALVATGDAAAAESHRERSQKVYEVLRHKPAQIELARSWASIQARSIDRKPGGSLGTGAARQVTENIAAVLMQTDRPELVASGLLEVLALTSCVPAAIAVSRDEAGREQTLGAFGDVSLIAASARTFALGTTCGRTVELRLAPPPDLASQATVNSLEFLLGTIRNLETARAEREERLTLWPDDEIVSEDGSTIATGKMRDLMLTARRVATTTVNVLITGESGTGKEILARTIHAASPRSRRPFVPFNCAAVPRELLESQLFGFRRGAFTGADRDHPGMIRTARDGTLFLDEIGELSLDLQPKLLRFLESGEIHPLGEPHPIRVDVRVVAATNANLLQLVEDGRFREDLYYRLNVVPLTIPPLRERRDEIPPLVRHFLAKAATEFDKGRVRVAEETMEHLLLYPWPGNVRQLQNELRRMVALAERDAILEPDTLSKTIRQQTRHVVRHASGLEMAVPLTDKLTSTIARIEREMIKVALRANEGRVEAAARALGISRKGLYLKRQRLGL